MARIAYVGLVRAEEEIVTIFDQGWVNFGEIRELNIGLVCVGLGIVPPFSDGSLLVQMNFI